MTFGAFSARMRDGGDPPLTNTLRFPATGSYRVDFGPGRLAYERTQAFTIVAWVKVNSISGYKTIITNRGGGDAQRGWALGIDGAGPYEFYIGNTSGVWSIYRGGSATIGSWELVSMAWSGNTGFGGNSCVFSEDGASYASTSVIVNTIGSSTAVSTSPLCLGSRAGTDWSPRCDMGPLAVFNKQLSNAEILDLYNGGARFDWRTSDASTSLDLYYAGVPAGFDPATQQVIELAHGWTGTPADLTTSQVIAIGP